MTTDDVIPTSDSTWNDPAVLMGTADTQVCLLTEMIKRLREQTEQTEEIQVDALPE